MMRGGGIREREGHDFSRADKSEKIWGFSP